jgi:Flp pilus assembly protein TadD
MTQGTDELIAQAKGLLRAGKLHDARSMLEKASGADPENARTWAELGSVLLRLNDFSGAKSVLVKSLRRDQSDWRVIHNFGRAQLQLDETEGAIQALTQAVALNPSAEAVWCDLGTAQMAAGAFGDAEYSFRYAISINKKFWIAYFNLANCVREQGRMDEALRGYRRALDANPDFSAAAAAYASTLSDAGRVEEALASLDMFLGRHPGDVECHQRKSLILLRAGHLSEGFKEYEWRLTPTQDGVPVRPFRQPRWQGQRDLNSTVLIWLEQGIGDEILSLSMLEALVADTGPCLVECDPRLVPLISRSFQNVTAVPRSDPPHPLTKTADLMCPIWSSGMRYRSEFGLFPQHSGYLKSDATLTSTLRHKYSDMANGRKVVGISWSSGGARGLAKTPPLETWRPLLQQENVFFISLQYAPAPEDIAALSDMNGQPVYVDHDIDHVSSIDNAAAQIAAVDGVVTVSNTAAHLAGALGRPVATVIPSGFGGFWYWFRERTDSPWYPSMALCRQSTPGDWASAVTRARDWINSES